METVGTRELKQNPNAVIQRVLETGDELEITAHGHPTGAKIVATTPTKAPWVPASALSHLSPPSRGDAQALRRDIDDMRDDDQVRDPWEDTE